MRSRVLNILKGIGGFLARHKGAIGRTVLVLVILAVSVLPAIVDNTAIGYLPVLMVVLGVILTFAYLQILKRGIRLEGDVDLQSCLRGEVVEVGVKVKNASFLLCPKIDVSLFISDLEGEVDTSVDQRFSLLPGEEKELELAARFDHIGTYQVGLRDMVIGDLFGLFNHKVKVGEAHQVQVGPRLVELSRFSVERNQATDVQNLNASVINDGFDYVGMRDYVLGDSMKTIHWKASARYEELMTRLYERQINPNVCVVLDSTTRWPHGEPMMCVYDAVVEATLSIASHASDNGIECTVVTVDEGKEARDFLPRGDWGYTDILNALPKLVEDKENVETAQAVHTAAAGMYSSSNIVICTSNPTEDLISEAISARMMGRHVELLFAHPADWERVEEDHVKRMLTRLSAAQIPYFMFSDAIEMGGE